MPVKGSPLPMRQRMNMLLVAGLALVIFVVYAFYVLRPMRQAVIDASKQLAVGRTQLHVLQATVTNETAVQREYHQVEERVKALRDRLPHERELPDLIELLSGFANQAHVKLQAITPQRAIGTEPTGRTTVSPPRSSAAATPPGVYRKVVIQIDAFTGYHELGEFLSLVESGKKPLRLAHLHISKGAEVGNPEAGKRNTIKLLIHAYFST